MKNALFSLSAIVALSGCAAVSETMSDAGAPKVGAAITGVCAGVTADGYAAIRTSMTRAAVEDIVGCKGSEVADEERVYDGADKRRITVVYSNGLVSNKSKSGF